MLSCLTADIMLWAGREGQLQLVETIRLLSRVFVSVDCIIIRVLRYVKGAVGETDVPDGLPVFINRRRRWLNGSFFAATYAIAYFGQMMSSGHSLSRKTMLFFQTIYNIINLIASWFAIRSSPPGGYGWRWFCPPRAISTYTLWSCPPPWRCPRSICTRFGISTQLSRYCISYWQSERTLKMSSL